MQIETINKDKVFIYALAEIRLTAYNKSKG